MRDLAIELKAAGFPQALPTEGRVVYHLRMGGAYVCHQGEYCNAPPCKNCPYHVEGLDPKDCIVLPTLEELLIRADQRWRFTLARVDDFQWKADAYTPSKTYSGGGKTPDEAVARLWLALNKK